VRLYLISFGVGLLVGLVYAALDVRSPAPPVVALVGLLGILAGEQARPLLQRWRARPAHPAASVRPAGAVTVVPPATGVTRAPDAHPVDGQVSSDSRRTGDSRPATLFRDPSR
jgi:XapX domain-containing protein